MIRTPRSEVLTLAGTLPVRRPHAAGRERRGGSALGVLRCLACLFEASLLPLLDPGIPGQEAKTLERWPTRRVDEYERPGNAEPNGACLAGHTAAGNPDHDVELAIGPERHQRLADELLMHLVPEVHVHPPAVDQPMPGAGHHPDPSDCLLATAGAQSVAGDDRLARGCLSRGGGLTCFRGVLRQVLAALTDLPFAATCWRGMGPGHEVALW